MKERVVEARGLVKAFPGGVVALDGLDLVVPRGAVYGLVGRNGAGKTTALRVLLGLLRQDGGEARVLGWRLAEAPPAERARVAYVSQEQRLHGWMTVAEHCHYVSQFYERWDGDCAAALLERFGLPADRQVGLLSGGEQRKAAVLLALAARPEVLVLDEPAAGLDPIARRALTDALIDALADGGGTTVLFSTHILTDLERLADHVGFVEGGRVVLAARLDELQDTVRRVQLIFEGDAPPADLQIPGALRVERMGAVVTAVVRVERERDLEAIQRTSGARAQLLPLSLEDIFVEVVGSGAQAQTEEVQA